MFPPGLTLFGLRGGGVLLTGSAQNVKFTESSALLFGTICAAVDPVAVSLLHHTSLRECSPFPLLSLDPCSPLIFWSVSHTFVSFLVP